ncbi:MAG: dienelactone hydrolase family protein [Verrucomicrobia bacterium]|nr:dienelactone hydrolase family protein [Verrucomicrobiota bacterium]
MKTTLSLLLLALFSLAARAEIRTDLIVYKDGDTVLQGQFVYNDALQGKRPSILLVHQWKGLGEYEKKRAVMLANLSYVVFCVDIYGKGVRPDNAKDAGALAGKYKADRALLRSRVNMGLRVMKTNERVNPQKIAAIGYCFGGTTVLELARGGADVSGVVSFHGGLSSPAPDDAKQIKCRVLALHGADDPFVPAEEVAGFAKEMRDAKVDWQLVSYGNAVHSFTDWGAGGDNSKGAAYNERADKRSWEAMKVFFAEIFR